MWSAGTLIAYSSQSLAHISYYLTAATGLGNQLIFISIPGARLATFIGDRIHHSFPSLDGNSHLDEPRKVEKQAMQPHDGAVLFMSCFEIYIFINYKIQTFYFFEFTKNSRFVRKFQKWGHSEFFEAKKDNFTLLAFVKSFKITCHL